MPAMLAIPNQPIPYRSKPTFAPTFSPAFAPAVQSPVSPATSLRVHFPSSTSLVSGVSRPLSVDEAWFLYDFEKHARTCHHCRSPYKRYKAGSPLCPYGDGLAQGIAGMVYMHHGEVYELSSHRRKPMRVEIPHTYTFVFEQLKVMEEVSQIRHASALSSRQSGESLKVQIHTERRERDAPKRSERAEVILETVRSDDRREGKGRRKEKYRHDPENRSERETEHREQREHRRRDKEYRSEEKKERPHRRESAEVEIHTKDKKYRTETRRPVWADEEGER